MKLRLISGLIAAPTLVALVYLGSAWLLTTVVLAVALMSYREFDQLLFGASNAYRRFRVSVLVAIAIISIRYGVVPGVLATGCAFFSIALNAVVTANRTGAFAATVNSTALEWLGFSYVVSLSGFIIPITGLAPEGRDWVMLLFLIVFVGDSTAYFGGRLLGRRRLANLLSPNKTLEGSLAGLAGAALAAYGWSVWIHPVNGGFRFWFLVVVTSLLAQLGDLFESLLKRSQTRKDSGTFLPGHGGLLDRIDGLVFSAPFFYAMLVWLTRVRG